MEHVILDHTEVEIISRRGSAVLLSKDEYDSLVETSYLLRSPKNAQRLLAALEPTREGNVVEHGPKNLEWRALAWTAGGWEDCLCWPAQNRKTLGESASSLRTFFETTRSKASESQRH
ncbi:type II toxin-antitoxin system Phd/YefM family antitoxin [Arthrobacter sp. HLT1-20]